MDFSRPTARFFIDFQISNYLIVAVFPLSWCSRALLVPQKFQQPFPFPSQFKLFWCHEDHSVFIFTVKFKVISKFQMEFFLFLRILENSFQDNL